MSQTVQSDPSPFTLHPSRAFRNLREFIHALEQRKLLHRIRKPVSPKLEITEITDRVTKSGGPALLFEKVEGSDLPLLINAFGTEERMALALQTPRLDDIAQRLQEFLKLKPPQGFRQTLATLAKLADLRHILPKTVSAAACQEVVVDKNPRLDFMPILTCWPQDGGPYITLPMVITRDPETGFRNVGCYRLQVFSPTELGMHWQVHKDGADHFSKYKAQGRPLDVAIAIGADPACVYAATAPLPPTIDEFLFAGFLRRSPVELVHCRTVDLEVPAESEIVLEGTVDPGQMRTEGPFGDHTGFYSLPEPFPVFRLKAVTYRRNPVYLTTVVGQPPQEDYFLGKASERIFLPLLQLEFPELVDLHFPSEGVFHNCCLVKIRKRYPGHAQKLVHGLWGLGQMMFTKLIIVVDEDVNIHNPSEAAWRVFNQIDPKRDIFFAEGPVDQLDVASSRALYGSKMGVDATCKGPEEGMQRAWPEIARIPDEVKKMVSQRWSEYGF